MKQQSYINSQPRWVSALSTVSYGLGTHRAIDAYLAHHKGWKTDLRKDRFPLTTILGNLTLFIARERAELFLADIVRVLTARGTHRVVYIGKVKYLEPVGLDKPFIQPGLHSFSQAPGFFQPAVAQA